ncbi:hypothetical protein IW150_000599 [Coemansia sp. RSA 2607]|nr:hypothetical protein GGI05_006796 [Coemansia sp. RSA 2603]KAJ2378760.1 hypothetical protein IW150_000599 [Coemansia sp. RSA 2607]
MSVPISERRRNTLETSVPPSGLLTPPTSPPTTPNSQMLKAMSLKDKQRVAPPLVGKMATILPRNAQRKTTSTFDSHMQSFDSNIDMSLPPPYTPMSADYSFNSSSSSADMMVSPVLDTIPEYKPTWQVVTEGASASESTERPRHKDHQVSLIVLDNKKIRFARPKLVSIRSLGKQ